MNFEIFSIFIWEKSLNIRRLREKITNERLTEFLAMVEWLRSAIDSFGVTRMSGDNLKHKDITDLILKGFYEVYNELGDGFLESVYESALSIVLKDYGPKLERQKGVIVYFRGLANTKIPFMASSYLDS